MFVSLHDEHKVKEAYLEARASSEALKRMSFCPGEARRVFSRDVRPTESLLDVQLS